MNVLCVAMALNEPCRQTLNELCGWDLNKLGVASNKTCGQV